SLAFSNYSTFLSTGVASSVTLTALDPAGKTATGYTGTVQLSSSDPAVQFIDPATGLPVPSNKYAFQASDAGVKTLTVIFNTAGTQSISATDSTNHLSQSLTGIGVHAASSTVSLIPVTNANDLVYDPTDGILFITAQDGTVQRYDLATQSLLAPLSI